MQPPQSSPSSPNPYPYPYPYDPTQPNNAPTVPLGGYPANGYPYTPYGYPYPPHAYPAQPGAARRPSAAKPPVPPRMPKAEAMALTRRLKRGTVWVALLSFLALAGLAAAHAVGVTSAAPSASNSGTSGGDDQQPSTQQNNPFFGSQPGSGPFGSGGGGSSGGLPVTGTSTS